MTANPHRIDLEPAVTAFLAHASDTTGYEPPPVGDERVTVEAGAFGALQVRIVRPVGATSPSPVVVYLRSPWTLEAHTHDRLVRELSDSSGAAVVVPDCAPTYPLAVEHAYAAARWVSTDGDTHGLDPSRIAVAGDSEGANLAIAATLLSLQRNEFQFRSLVAFTPVTDATCGSASFRKFADGYHLRADQMRQRWDRYTPDAARRTEPTASPVLAELADLERFPPSLIITAEADVVRDEGEAFAARLRLAGASTTAVRYEGTIHDFVVLGALQNTSATRAAIAQAASALTFWD